MTFRPDFDNDCYQCGSRPCVMVEGHVVPYTHLCGACFFGNPEMHDWQEWPQADDEQ